MSTAGRLLPLFLTLFVNGFASESTDFEAVRAADQARLAATLHADTLKLSSLLSDDLHYAYSDGRVQTKAQFIAAVASNKVKYLSFEPYDVTCQQAADGVVAMSGRAKFAAQAGQGRVEFALQFLAVWRRESGQWRLLAYQSSQLAQTGK